MVMCRAGNHNHMVVCRTEVGVWCVGLRLVCGV